MNKTNYNDYILIISNEEYQKHKTAIDEIVSTTNVELSVKQEMDGLSYASGQMWLIPKMDKLVKVEATYKIEEYLNEM